MLKKRVPLKGRVETFRLRSKVLAGNPLGDPAARDVTVYVPPGHDPGAKERVPLLVDVVGFMGSGPAHVGWKAFQESVPERVERLVREGRMGPVVVAFPDCWTRLGGNQYVNSAATGRYADYLLEEVVPAVEARFGCGGSRARRGVFGKSSGGYGALIHAMRHGDFWGAAACHSGDMFFELCYRQDVPAVVNRLAKCGRDPARFLKELYANPKASSEDTHVLMFLAMAATYDPDPDEPLGFHLPMDLHTAEVDEGRWKRWIAHDPIRLVHWADVKKSLRSLKGLYVDCGSRDQYHLHFGARILHRELERARIAHRYEEFDDDHSSIDYRMDESLPFLWQALTGARGGRGRRKPARRRRG